MGAGENHNPIGRSKEKKVGASSSGSRVAREGVRARPGVFLPVDLGPLSVGGNPRHQLDFLGDSKWHSLKG